MNGQQNPQVQEFDGTEVAENRKREQPSIGDYGIIGDCKSGPLWYQRQDQSIGFAGLTSAANQCYPALSTLRTAGRGASLRLKSSHYLEDISEIRTCSKRHSLPMRALLF